jgi:hypothetical protein
MRSGNINGQVLVLYNKEDISLFVIQFLIFVVHTELDD